MDHQDLRRNNSSGHGVHLCGKCGWPFPNPHPSAKHRRAHKRVCGTIQGYKMADSQDTPLSDDDHSDEDHSTTPSSKVVERTISTKGIGGIGSASNRSEDEVFSDAVTEFQESDPVTNMEKITENDRQSTQSFKDSAILDGIQPPGNSADINQLQNPEVPKSMTNLLGSTQESQDHESSFTEAVVMSSNDRSGSSQDLYLIKPKTPADIQEDKKINADVDVTERSITYVGQETHAKGNEEINLDGNVPDVVVPTGENASETSEAVSKSEYTQKITSDPMPGEGVVQMKEGDLSAKDESVEHMNDSVDTVQIKMDAAQGIDFASSVKSVEGYKKTEEGNENLHVLSVPGDIHVVENAEMKLEEFKDHKGLKSHQSVTLDSCKTIRDNEDDLEDPLSEKNFSSFQPRHLSEGTEVYASDMHVVKDNLNHEGENSKPIDKEVPIEGETAVPKIKFTNNEGSNDLEAPTDSLKQGGDCQPMVKEVPVEGEADVSWIKPTNNEGSNELEAPTDNLEHEGQSRKPMVEKIPVEGEADVFEINLTNNARSSDLEAPSDKFEREGGNSKLKELTVEGVDDVPQIRLTNEGSDELGACTDDVTVEMEESRTVCSPEEPQPRDICNDSSQMSSPGTATDVLLDVNLMVAPVEAQMNQTTNLVDMDGAGNHEKATIKICELARDDEKKRAEEETYTESTITTFESSSSLSESHQIIPTTSLLEVDSAGDHGKGKIENSDVVGIESREGAVEKNLSKKTETTPGSAGGLHESQIVSEDVMDASVGKSPETECTHVDGVSDTWGGVKKLEINDNNKVQGECVNEVSLATESYHGGDVELLPKTSKDHLTKEPLLPPLNTASSIQSSATDENYHAREFGGNASGISSQSLQGEGNNSFVKHQLGASAMDVSVDSCSQTDSLEGNWGSVSVLSTQSDAVIDAEERTNLQRPKVPFEGQHSDKSEIFDAPSFMTLVQPGGGSDQKGAENQTVESSQEPKAAPLQSGWFPSLTHVANESQGRKKNEEIIAKVTNWSTGKQHTPLMSLLSEANLEAKPKSPNPKENQGLVVQKDETAAKDNGAMATKVSSILGPEVPIAEPAKREMGKEWNSPARYPADIKREKRKVKGRPFWVQFACCSSVN